MATPAGLTERTVSMGREAPLPIRVLPDAPAAIHLLGPGMVLTALGVGLGETFMWPRLVMIFGPNIRWLFLLGVTLQLVVMMEMARWAMATGESIFFGAARLGRWIMWFFFATAILVYIWPGHVSLGAQALESLTGIPWVWSAVVGLVLIGIILTIAKKVYNVVEGVLSTLISVLVVGSAIIASMVGNWGELADTLTGLVAIGWTTPKMFEAAWFPVLVGSIAFAGPSGMQQMWYTLYLRDKGAGMGHYIPKIKGLFSKEEEETVPARGFTFDTESPQEMKKWQAWKKWNTFDAWVLFWGITMLTTVIFTVLAMSASRLNPEVMKLIAAGKSTAALDGMAAAFGAAAGKVTSTAFYIFIAVVGWKMTFGIFDAFSRGQADMTYFFVPGAKRMKMNRLYYLFLWGIVAIGIVTLLIGSPKGPGFILDTLAFLSTFVMGAYCLLLMVTNNVLLPKPLRPGWLSNLAMGVAAVFYLGGLFYSFFILGALPKG